MKGTSGIPQATLEKVRAVVDGSVKGANTVEALIGATQLSRRHVDYAIAAACSLGFLRVTEGRIASTASGKRLSATEHASRQELRMLTAAINESPIISSIAPKLLSAAPPSRQDIADRIVKQTGLSRATALHRGGMILEWRRALQKLVASREE